MAGYRLDLLRALVQRFLRLFLRRSFLLPRGLSRRAIALCVTLGLAWILAWAPMSAVFAQDGARPVVSEPWLAEVTYVVDGDSLWVRSSDAGRRRKLRLNGVDAPEICQAHGRRSRAALQELVQGQRVRVTVQAYDRYARGIATIERVRDKLDVGKAMVRQGWATSDDFRGRKGRYWREQVHAREQRLGVFAKGTPESPAAFRKRHGPCSTSRKG